ncbi:ABZJ_00895 family protein [Maribacter dokdonensis]|uniref:ABZJ_00895 family protein n=1 Tax=Maribacter dokdonensis TaxID=320912 RepID=UPI00349EA8B7
MVTFLVILVISKSSIFLADIVLGYQANQFLYFVPGCFSCLLICIVFVKKNLRSFSKREAYLIALTHVCATTIYEITTSVLYLSLGRGHPYQIFNDLPPPILILAFVIPLLMHIYVGYWVYYFLGKKIQKFSLRKV